jgi:hypothetical protein
MRALLPQVATTCRASSSTEVSRPVPRLMAARSPASPVTAATRARATSATYTKSRVWLAVAEDREVAPARARSAKIEMTPEYGLLGSWRGP